MNKTEYLENTKLLDSTKLAIKLWWLSEDLQEREQDVRELCREDGHPIQNETEAIDCLTGTDCKRVWRSLREISLRLDRAASILSYDIEEKAKAANLPPAAF